MKTVNAALIYNQENKTDIKNNLDMSVSTGNNSLKDNNEGKIRVKTEINNEINGQRINGFKLDKLLNEGEGKIDIKNEVRVNNNKVEVRKEFKINGKLQEQDNGYKLKPGIDQKKMNDKKSINDNLPKPKNIKQENLKESVGKMKKQDATQQPTDKVKEIISKVKPIWQIIYLSLSNVYDHIDKAIKLFI